MWILKLLLVGVFLFIFIQDYKEREVFWFLYPSVGILAFFLQMEYVHILTALLNISLNLLFVSFLLIVCYTYTRFKLQRSFLKEVFGLGDVLFFIFIAFSFSIISFQILFVFALVFSLLLHLILQFKKTEKTVPLAGYMSLFFGVVYSISFFCDSNFLYAY
ncbi:general secretion pathway protein [Flavobacterium sp. LS1P28]|nr:general secretion pathway protein [Flavobacterium sp. LS1P28]